MMPASSERVTGGRLILSTVFTGEIDEFCDIAVQSINFYQLADSKKARSSESSFDYVIIAWGGLEAN